MKTHSLRRGVAEHPFFEDLDARWVDFLVSCARNERFEAGTYLAREGDGEHRIYLIRTGRVAVEKAVHHRPLVVQTYGPGEVLGASGLTPPYVWAFDARAVESTRVISLDAVCLRRKCEADPALGYVLLQRFSQDLERRLYGAWMQMADVYGPPQ